jgi:transposase
LLVSKNAYPLAYDIFEGNKYEGDTFLSILEGFKENYKFEKLTVVADAGLLSRKNINELIEKNYDFILGARIKNEKEAIQRKILALSFENDKIHVINKDYFKLLITHSEYRLKKDSYNREKAIKKLEKKINTGKLSKVHLNNRGYNKFLKMEGDVALSLDKQKVESDSKWDGLKGYLTNS